MGRVICTSTVVKNNVETILHAQVDVLKMRLGIQKELAPVAGDSLGVHTDDFHYSEVTRASSRQQLGVTDDTLVVLYVGRLSFHGKAHPLAMYQALENATKATGHKAITLIECGWHANEQIGTAFTQAKSVSPSVSNSSDGRVEAIEKSLGPALISFVPCRTIFRDIRDSANRSYVSWFTFGRVRLGCHKDTSETGPWLQNTYVDASTWFSRRSCTPPCTAD